MNQNTILRFFSFNLRSFVMSFLFFVSIANSKAQINAWEVTWTYEGATYEGLLWQSSSTNQFVMLVRYYSNGLHIIEETFEVESSDGIILLSGNKPRFTCYTDPYAEYRADNLVLSGKNIYTLDNLDDPYNIYNWSKLVIIRQFYTNGYFKSIKANKYECR
jgi:hypothetical protein